MKVNTSRQECLGYRHRAAAQRRQDPWHFCHLEVRASAQPGAALDHSSVRGVITHQWDNSGVEARNVFAPNANFGRYSLSDLTQEQFSQEFQAIGDFGDSFTYVVGAYYFNEHARESAATPFTNVWNADGSAFTIRSSTGTFGTAAITSCEPGLGARHPLSHPCQ